MTVTETDAVAADEPAELDPALVELLEKLGPAFLEVAKAAVTESIAAVPTPTFRPGDVQGIDPAARTASVLIDGDTAPITAQILTDLPGVNDRVMVTFVPPSSVFVTGLISASGVPPGSVQAYAGPITHHPGAESSATSGAPPRGWLWCAGQTVSRATYSALFAAIGETYGSGDGSTTFAVPDFRGRVPVGLDNMGGTDAGRLAASNTLGGTGGSNTISTSQLPSHAHDLGSHSHSWSGSGSLSGASTSYDGSHNHTASNLVSATAGVAAGTDYTGDVGTTSFGTSYDGTHSHSVSGSVSISGSVGAVYANTGYVGSGAETLPPYLLIHWLIKA